MEGSVARLAVSATGKADVKPARTYSRRPPVKRVTKPSTKLIVPGGYLSRNPYNSTVAEEPKPTFAPATSYA